MSAADLIVALKSATPEERNEIYSLLVDIVNKYAKEEHVEAFRERLQVGDRFTSKPLISKPNK